MPDRRPPARTRRQRPGAREALPVAGTHPVDTGVVELVPDQDDPQGWTVVVNGVPSSYVHLGDPTRLEFEYMRWIGDVLDTVPAPGRALAVTHLGGAGCSLPRYVAATRPGSHQVVLEVDGALAALARESFGATRSAGIGVRAVDARAGLADLAPGSQDAVVRDAFAGDEVPAHLTTLEFLVEVRRVLAPGGLYVANVADRADVGRARTEAATAREVFVHVALVAEPAQLRGRRYGNVVLVASDAPLPETALARRLAGGAVRARLVVPERVAELVSGVPVRHDAG